MAPLVQSRIVSLLQAMADAGQPSRVDETLRTPERSDWLYGFGRTWDDGRGTVSNAQAGQSQHNFGVAADIVHATLNWDAPESYWQLLCECAEANRLSSGYRYHHPDKPHVAAVEFPLSPTDADRALLAQGLPAVWTQYSLNPESV